MAEFRYDPGRLQSSMAAERILVVDDEDAIREIVSSMLSFANYQCRQAASGKEALALLDSRRRIRAHAFRPDDGRTRRHRPARADQGKVSGHARRHGYRRARHLGRPACYSQRRLRLSAEAFRARTTPDNGSARSREPPPEDSRTAPTRPISKRWSQPAPNNCETAIHEPGEALTTSRWRLWAMPST